MIKELTYPSTQALGLQRVSWGAIWAGAIFTTALVILFLVLGVGLGLAASPSVSPGALVFGAALWWLVTGEISFFFGGWMAGRLTHIARVSESVIHAMIAWGMSTLAVTYIALGLGEGFLRGGAIAGLANGPHVARLVGGVGVFGALVMLSEMFAAALGARAGTRLLVRAPAPHAVRREEAAGVVG